MSVSMGGQINCRYHVVITRKLIVGVPWEDCGNHRSGGEDRHLENHESICHVRARLLEHTSHLCLSGAHTRVQVPRQRGVGMKVAGRNQGECSRSDWPRPACSCRLCYSEPSWESGVPGVLDEEESRFSSASGKDEEGRACSVQPRQCLVR